MIRARESSLVIAALAILIGCIFAVYWPAHAYPFLLDDEFHFVSSWTVRSWSAFSRLWVTDYWEQAGSGLYRPLLRSIWMLEIAGLGGSKAVVLLASILFHSLNVAMVMLIGRKAGLKWIFACLAGAWFALHPAHVEVLLTGVGQGEIFTLFLGLLAVWMVFPDFRSAQQPESSAIQKRLRLTVFVLALSLNFLIKEQSFTALAVALVVLWCNREFGKKQRTVVTALVMIWLAASIALRIHFLGSFGPQKIYQLAAEMSVAQRFIFVLYTIGRYIVLALAPMRLVYEYSWLQYKLPMKLSEPYVWVGLAGLIGTISMFVIALRRRDLRLFLLLAIALLPMGLFLNVRPIGTMFAERHLYHSLAGVAVLIALGFQQAISFSDYPARSRRIVLGAAAMWCVVFAWKAASEVKIWRNGLTLWQWILERQPDSFFAASSLSYYQLEAGRFSEARRNAQLSVNLLPGYPEGHMTLGELDLMAKRPDRAKANFEIAGLHPAFKLRAEASIAIAELRMGKVDFARSEYERISRLDPHVTGLQLLKRLLDEQK